MSYFQCRMQNKLFFLPATDFTYFLNIGGVGIFVPQIQGGIVAKILNKRLTLIKFCPT